MSIEEIINKAGGKSIDKHDLRELKKFQEFLKIWKAMKAATGDERKALAKKCIELSEK